MREFKIVLGADFPAKRAGKIARWLSAQPRSVRELLFLSLTAAVTTIDMSLGRVDTDALYTLPLLLACWMFKPVRSVISALLIVAILAIKYVVVDFDPNPLVLIADVLVHSTVLLFLTATIISFRELFDYVQRLAVRDHMTGLLNKAAFNDHVETTLTDAKANGKFLLFLLLDLDGFKEVNDTCGHAVGDELLQTFSRDALGSVRRDDCFGRVGGDEFAAVFDVAGPAEAQTLVADLHQRFTSVLASTGYPVTCSIGAVVAERTVHHTPLSLFQEADALLYSVKRLGKNGFQISLLGKCQDKEGSLLSPQAGQPDIATPITLDRQA